MKRMMTTLFMLVFLLPSLSWACIVPRAGEEYNALIKVEKIGKNTFTVSVPQTAFDLHYGADIQVAYYAVGDDELKSGKHWQAIDIKEQDNEYIGTFTLQPIAGYLPLVEVFWYPEANGLCGAYGKSENLDLL